MTRPLKEVKKVRIILGISGKRGVGKTAAAQYLRDNYGFKIVSFASELKELGEKIFPGVSKAKKEEKFGNYDWTPREFYINLGQFVRYYDQDYWIRSADVEDARGRVVIDDVRFPNEVAALTKLGAKILRIDRYEKQNPYGKNLDDISETSLDTYASFDFKIMDCENTTLKELHSRMDRIIRNFFDEKS